jgi:hypothetical protein
VPGHVTSVRVIVPVSDADPVQLTPAVIVSVCPATTGFGVERTRTVLGRVAAGAMTARETIISVNTKGRTVRLIPNFINHDLIWRLIVRGGLFGGSSV